jgi:hypothetical protein
VTPGSANLNIGVPADASGALDSLVADMRNGVDAGMGARVLSFTDPATGALVVSPSSGGTPGWIIAVAVVVGMCVVALLVLVTVLLVRRGQHSRSLYHPLLDTQHPMDTITPQNVASPSSLRLHMAASVSAIAGESVMGVNAGEVVDVQKSDWEAGGEWMWVTKVSNGESGYVPKALIVAP